MAFRRKGKKIQEIHREEEKKVLDFTLTYWLEQLEKLGDADAKHTMAYRCLVAGEAIILYSRS